MSADDNALDEDHAHEIDDIILMPDEDKLEFWADLLRRHNNADLSCLLEHHLGINIIRN